MRDTVLFPLDDAGDWVLGADNLQWIVLRARKRRDEAYLHPVSYVTSTKTVLARVARENGVTVSASALAHLDAMPEHFRDWRDGHLPREAD